MHSGVLYVNQATVHLRVTAPRILLETETIFSNHVLNMNVSDGIPSISGIICSTSRDTPDLC